MNAFRLEFALQTPLILGQHPLSLDGLVWHGLYMKWGCPNKAVAKLADYFEFTDGVAHASTLLFGVTPSQPLLALSRAYVGGFRRSELDAARIKPNGTHGRYAKISTREAPFKNRLTWYRAYHAPAVVFYGAGDGERIAELLRYYVLSLGKECKRGSGYVGEIRLYSEDEDRSLIDQGAPSRFLPVELYRSLTGREPQRVAQSHVVPPYRGIGNQLCAVPERIRKFELQL